MTPILLSALLLTAPPRDIIANTFLDVEGNEKLLERLGTKRY